MKRNSRILVILAVIFSLIFVNMYSNKLSMAKTKYSDFVICIDPGHQSKGNSGLEPIAPGSKVMKAKVSSGTTGVFSKVPEYKLALKISLKLRDILVSDGFKVVMTRETNDVNISNAERAMIANKAKADLGIRIHADGSTDKGMNGISVLYPAKTSNSLNIYEKSKTAASFILSSVTKETLAKANGTVPRSDLTGFNWSEVPSILIETGFMTNVNEDKKLQRDDYESKIAKGIATGIETYIMKLNEIK